MINILATLLTFLIGITPMEVVTEDLNQTIEEPIPFTAIPKIERDAMSYVYLVNQSYYYNRSNPYSTYLTTEQLIQQGGTCSHYAKWFIQLAQADNYFAKPIRVNLETDELHEMAIMSNRQGYCILDSQEEKGAIVVGCWT